MQDNLSNKKKLRKEFREILFSLNDSRKEKAAKEATQRLIQISSSHSVVASFAPQSFEIDIWPFNIEMMKQRKLALPKVSGNDIVFYRLKSMEDLSTSPLNILEPKLLGPPLGVQELSLLLVPALAFDDKKFRLGRGKGYYDRFLSEKKSFYSLGVGYLEQHSKKPLPCEGHDQAVHDFWLF